MNKKVFISFGGGNKGYNIRANEVCDQIKELQIFDKIIPYTEYDLMQDEHFWNSHHQYLTHPYCRRGFGFMLWKPYIVLKTLEKMEEDDILIYTDCGCVINPEGVPRLYEYIDILEKNDFGLLAFQLGDGCKEINFTKRALLEFMNVSEQDRKSPQIITTCFFMKKTVHLMNFLYSWYKIACESNYLYIHGYPSFDEFPEYIDHRHDQSIFSVLIKKYMNQEGPRPYILPDETYFIEDEWESIAKKYPIWAKRKRQPDIDVSSSISGCKI